MVLSWALISRNLLKINEEKKAYALIRQGQKVLEALEDLACPTLSVINGYTLGGGLELAMACNYRIAIKSDRPIIGLPEVQLGLHPGFGGTVRAVKIAGVRAAMKLMLTGKPIRVNVAHKNGLIERLCTDEEWQNQARSHDQSQAKTSSRARGRKNIEPLFLKRLYCQNIN